MNSRIGFTDKLAVICVDLNGKYIGEYESINRAASKLNIAHSNITGCIKGKNLTINEMYFIDKRLYAPEKNYSLKYRKALRQFRKGK